MELKFQELKLQIQSDMSYELHKLRLELSANYDKLVSEIARHDAKTAWNENTRL